ncbi:hypothetical protein M7I_2118 [Glarea lozoyensis 74030]|uniref:Uncharacterized protein n=1 Tax=Glarea lozoyensis (strain ATCC 74030 / MF5533) TaxID=1104152 RepID=H0EHX5_GLAL7|nr:hypothetical protein M7I_2118 [Glarea lozoyensis 74030]
MAVASIVCPKSNERAPVGDGVCKCRLEVKAIDPDPTRAHPTLLPISVRLRSAQ